MPSASSLDDIFGDNHLEEILFLCMLVNLDFWKYSLGVGGMRCRNIDFPCVHTGVRARHSSMWNCP